MKKSKILYYSIIFIVGIFYIFATPIMMVPDEDMHYAKAYFLSEGRSDYTAIDKKVGAYFDRGVYEFISTSNRNNKFNSLGSVEDDSGDKKFINFTNTYIYPDIAYRLQGLATSKFDSLKIGFYFTRIIMWIISFFIYLGAKRACKSLWVDFVFLLPINLQLSISYNIDGINNALILLFISIVFGIKNNVIKLNKIYTVLLVLIAIFISMIKFVYFPIIFILLILFEKNNRKTNLYICGVILISFIIEIVSVRSVNMSSFLLNDVSNPEIQMNWVLNNPVQFILLGLKSFVLQLGSYYYSVFRLGWLDVQLPNIITILYTLIAIILLSMNSHDLTSIKEIKGVTLFIVIIATVVGLISTSLFIYWTTPGSALIEGIQGRYFTPLIPLVITVIAFLRSKIRIIPVRIVRLDLIEYVIMSLMVLLNIYSVIYLYSYYI